MCYRIKVFVIKSKPVPFNMVATSRKWLLNILNGIFQLRSALRVRYKQDFENCYKK